MNRILLFFLFSTLLFSRLQAQFSVKVQVNVVQPVPPYLPQIKADIAGNRTGLLNQDISSHLSIILSYTGRAQAHIKLAGSIERVAPSPMGVSLRPDFQPAQPIIMGPQQTMLSLTKDLLQSAFGNFSENSLVYSNMDLNTLRQNGVDYKLPEGTYRVCVTAYDYDKAGFSTPLSAPGTGCAYFTICYTASAPQLILPVSTMMQSNSEFQNFIPRSPQIQFVWTPPATTCGMPLGALTYDLEIRRVFNEQTVTDAQSNPYVFHQQHIPATTFLLDTLKYAHVLVPGQKYTVRVKADFIAMPGSPLEIANQGYSQIAAFAYLPLAPASTNSQPGLAFHGDTVPTTIKGRLQYRFPEDNSGLTFPVAHERIYFEKVFVKAGYGKDSILTYTPLTAGEQNSLPPYQDMLDGMITQTDAAGNFELKCGMTTLDSSGVIPGSKWSLLFSTASPAVQSLKGQLACLYKVITTNPHYQPYDQYLTITPGGVRDVTSLVLNANSYTFNVNVREVFNNQQGNYVPGADVKIYRLTSNKKDRSLGIPLYEGDILDSARDWKEIGDKVLIAARETPTPAQQTDDAKAYTVSFPRLFRNLGADPYNYLVCLEKGGVVLQQVTYTNVMGLGSSGATRPSGITPSPGVTVSTSSTANGAVIASKTTTANKSWTLLFDEADALFGKRTAVQSSGSSAPRSAIKSQPVSATQLKDTLRKPASVAEVTDEWTSWAYKGYPDTASLTLEKELVAPPHSMVTGTLQYQYKNDKATPARPYANMPVKLMVFYLFKGTPAPAATGTGNVSRSTGTGNTSRSNGLLTGYYSGVALTYASQDQPYRLAGQSNTGGTEMETTANGEITDNGKVLQTVNTDANGHFTFDFENTDSTMQVQQGKLTTGIQPGYLPSGQSQSGSFMRVYRVVPAVSYYCAPDDNVPVQPWGSYDCGTLTSMVHTYNLNVTILDQTGNSFGANVPVNLCRYTNDPYSSEQPANPAGSAYLNKPTSLSGASSYGSGSGGSAGGSDGSTGGKANSGNAVAMKTVFQLPGQNIYTLNSCIIKRQGLTGSTGSITFNNVVVSMDGQKDEWLVQADGSATQRTGTLTFTTAYQTIPKDFTYSGPTAYFNGLPGENSGNVSSYATDYANFPPYSDPAKVVFNSQFDPGQTFNDSLTVKKNAPRYAGRVVDAFTTLGIPNIGVRLDHKNYADYYTNGVFSGDFDATTDANGYYDVTQYTNYYNSNPSVTPPDEIYISAPGYEQYTKSLGSLTWGQQDYEDPIVLKPIGANCFGYVADADNPSGGVTARVKIKANGRWVDTYAYSGDPNKPSTSSSYLVTGGVYKEMINQAVAANYIQTTGSSSPGKSGAAATSNPGPNSFGKAAPVSLTFGGLQVQVNKDGSIQGMNIKETAGMTAGYWKNVVAAGKAAPGNGPSSFVSGVQRFDMDLAAIADSIIIMPYDPAYLTQTFAVHPTASGQNLGTFLLQRRKHKVLVQVTMQGQRPAIGAIVSVDGVPGPLTVDSKGQAYFEFVNNATENFTVRVSPSDKLATTNVPGLAVFVDTSLTFKSLDDGTSTYVPVRVSPGQVISGKVTFDGNGQPVQGAMVYVDQGSGSNSAITTTTDPTGAYRLVGVPLASAVFGDATPTADGFVVKATYSAPGKTYTGDQQTLNNSAVTHPVNLVIHELNGIDISRLYGFPARLEKAVQNSDHSYTIDGELYDIPANANFAMRTDKTETALPFHGLQVKASTLKNTAGTPFAVPLHDSIPFDSRILSVNAFSVFDAEISEAGDGVLYIRKAASDTSGVLNGQAHIVDNSFNFPSSYMTIANTDFYLGNYGQPAGNSKLQIPIFPSDAAHYALTKFSITTEKAAAITFKYLGFNGVTGIQGSRESFVMGDSVNLFMNLTTTIQDQISLQFNAGKAVIRHDGISRMVNEDSIRFNLEKWTVASGKWELSPTSGGIVIDNGMLYTGKADLPFANMTIIAGDPSGELSCNSFTGDALRDAAAKGLLTIGGGTAKLKIYNGTNATFVYDPNVGTTPGQGHFKLSLESDAGKAAYFGGLDGMTNATQRFDIQFLSELSDGEELFAFDPNGQPVTFYNQLQFSPQNLFSYEDRLVLGGGVSTGITSLPDNIAGTFTFSKVSNTPSRTNQLNISPLLFSFTGDGGTQFQTTSQQGTQQFNQYGIGLSGDMTIPGVNGVFKSNLVSMVTSGAAGLINASGDADAVSGIAGGAQNIKQQAEVLLGDALNQAQAFGDQAEDEVKGVVNDARNTLMSQLNNARNTLEQSLPIGAAQQQIADLAAKWRLAGEGIDAIKDFKNDPAGSLLRLNGVLKGFTGINADSIAADKLKMVANEALSGMQDNLPVDKISNAVGGAASTFNGMQFDFDLKNGRITGSLSMPELDFGAVLLYGIGIEMLMDRQGWYFYTGAGMDLPQSIPLHPLLFPLSVGIIIGDYPTISPDLTSRITQNSYVKKLPNTYSQGIHGFFITGKKEILQPTALKIDFDIVNFEIGASAGLDARLYANFGGQSQQIGMAGMEFGNAYAKLDVLGTCGVSGSADLNVGLKASFTNDQKGVTLKAAACASISLNGQAWCGVGPAQVSGSFSKSIMAILTLCAGADCGKAIDFNIYLNGGSCSSSNDFDY